MTIYKLCKCGKKLSEENLQSLCLACHNEKTKNELKG